MTNPRIGFLLPRYSRHSTSCWPLVVKAVADFGAEVEIVHPFPGPLDLSALQVRHDLYVLRKLSGLALSLAGALHELGAAILNRLYELKWASRAPGNRIVNFTRNGEKQFSALFGVE